MPYSKYVSMKNIDVVLSTLGNIPDKIMESIKSDMAEITQFMYDEAKKDIAVIDEHTLEELAKMGHPYSTRPDAPTVPHNEPLVHSQSGKLLDNLKKDYDINEKRGYMKVYVNKEDVEYIDYLIHGTTTMVGRNVFAYTYSRIGDDCIRLLKRSLDRARL